MILYEFTRRQFDSLLLEIHVFFPQKYEFHNEKAKNF